MTIDETIVQEREKAKEQKSKYDKCPTRTRYNCEMCFHNPKCDEDAKGHEQLAELLEELKARREADRTSDSKPFDVLLAQRYNKAIDDFVKYIDECSGWTPNCIEHDISLTVYTLHQIAEQLKAGGENE